MGSFSIWHWMVVLVVVLLFFGAGRLPSVMGDLAKGIKNFRAGMREPDPIPETSPAAHANIEDQTASAATIRKDEVQRS